MVCVCMYVGFVNKRDFCIVVLLVLGIESWSKCNRELIFGSVYYKFDEYGDDDGLVIFEECIGYKIVE